MRDDWVEWAGGGCPVDYDTKVYVRFRDGCEELGKYTAGCYRWNYEGVDDDIVSYRVVKEEAEPVETKQSKLKGSGERRETATGAVRDRAKGKGRFDLLPMHGMLLCAKQMEDGAEKYIARNWEKGMPLSWFADSASRHLAKFIAGYDDEPHLSGAIWNLMCLAEGQERIKQGLWPEELDDLPKTYAGKQPNF